MRAADRLCALLLALFGVFVSVEARALPYWSGHSPGPGFLPFWLGVLLTCASAAMFARTFRTARSRTSERGEPAPLDRATAMRSAVVVGLAAGCAALGIAIGLVLATGVFMAATLAYLRPGHARVNWATALLTPLAIWLLFVRWLSVPLPAGPFGF
jgi:putative tricarboxylic transport membrane protein